MPNRARKLPASVRPPERRETSVHALVEAPAWAAVLEQFASATGVSVAFTDPAGRLRAGPFAQTPLGHALVAGRAWEENGACVRSAASVARAAIEAGGVAFGSALDVLCICAAPIVLDGAVFGAVVVGWVFESFLDPVAADRLAKQLGSTFPALWHVLRQQGPVSREKLRAHVELIARLGASFLGEIASSEREKRRANELELLNRAARGFASARTEEEIAEISVDTACQLVDATEMRLLYRGDDDLPRLAAHRDVCPPSTRGSRGESFAAMNVTRLPLAVVDREPLGWLEIGVASGHDGIDESAALAALAAQTAVALANLRANGEVESQRAALERANRVKDEFLATVSHELRTPLNAILGWTQIVRRGQVSGEKLDRALATIERNARAQEKLIGDLLDLSRIITGKLRLEMQPVDVAAVVHGAVESMRPAIDAKHQTLDVRVGDLEGAISGDPVRLQQIVWNLLSNAVKFTPEGGSIDVEATRDGNAVRIAIADSGIGIARAFLPYVFDAFRQADGSTTRQHGGLGLGLAIVRHLVELHGGTIAAESPGERGGATFNVRVPATDHPAAGAPSSAPAQRDARRSEHRPLRGLRVLVVDDDVDSRAMAALVIEGAGADVETCASADQAIVAMQRLPADVIVSDIAMPGIDGYALLRRIRRLGPQNGAHIPAIAVTARVQADDRVRALQAGFQVHVAKPIEPSELVAAIAASVGRFDDDP